MTGFFAFLQKEFTEIWRTWRIWVIPGMLLFFGVTSPIIALLTPSLVQSMASAQPGVVIKLPPATTLDASAQFIKNLDQFILIAIVIAGAGVVSGERASGTAILALTKPLSRGAFVMAKIVSQVTVLVVAAILGTAACLAMTAVAFHGARVTGLVTAVTLWLLSATLLVVVMTLFSAAFRSRGAAAGAGLGFYFVTLLFSNWKLTADYTFLGLQSAMRDALRGVEMSLAWPIGTAVLAMVGGAWAAVRIFERQEL